MSWSWHSKLPCKPLQLWERIMEFLKNNILLYLGVESWVELILIIKAVPTTHYHLLLVASRTKHMLLGPCSYYSIRCLPTSCCLCSYGCSFVWSPVGLTQFVTCLTGPGWAQVHLWVCHTRTVYNNMQAWPSILGYITLQWWHVPAAWLR